MAILACLDCEKSKPLNAVRGRCSKCYARHMRARNGTKALFCEVCRFEFQSKRIDARFCSSACRQMAYRLRISQSPRGTEQHDRGEAHENDKDNSTSQRDVMTIACQSPVGTATPAV